MGHIYFKKTSICDSESDYREAGPIVDGISVVVSFIQPKDSSP